MQQCAASGFPGLVALVTVFSSALTCILAFPTVPFSGNLSLVQDNASSLVIPPRPRPPPEPTCPPNRGWGITIGRPSYSDCDYILTNLYPKDPMAQPVVRNFFTKHADVTDSMPNFRLPYEQSHRTCNIQMLLATDFNVVPRDEATWNELRGVTRTIFRTCILGKDLGGVVTRNGKHGNIEIVVYGTKSVYTKNQILKNSPDPLARSIAAQELLELLSVVEEPDTPSTGVESGPMAAQTANATNTSALVTAGTFVATS